MNRNGIIKIKSLCALLIGFWALTARPVGAQDIDLGGLLMGVIDAVSQQGTPHVQDEQHGKEMGWKFYEGHYGRKPNELYNKAVCLDVIGSGFLARYSVSLMSVNQLRRCPGVFWVNTEGREIILDTSLSMLSYVSENNPAQRAVNEAKQAGMLDLLERSIVVDKENEAKKQRQDYLDDFENASNLEDIQQFESKYAGNDPDGLILHLQSKKEQIILQSHQAYREQFANAKTSDQLQGFISSYRSNDPDGLVPLAQQNLADIRANEEIAEKAKVLQKQENEKIKVVQMVNRFASEIKRLGFPSNYLKSTIYLQDGFNNPQQYITFELWLARIFDSGKYSALSRIKIGASHGVLLKRRGMPSMGILFRMDGGDLFVSHMSNGEKTVSIRTPNDYAFAAIMIIDATKSDR